MPFESIKARLTMLLDTATHQPEDLHELQETLREDLAKLQAQGLPLPDDLVHLEKRLNAELSPKK